METVIQYLLLALALASAQISLSESRLNEKRRDKTERRYHPRDYVEENICDIGDRESKVHCYCDNGEVAAAARADCWVFSGGLAETDPLWDLFHKQPNIQRLTFNVRFNGALNFVPLHVIRRLHNLHKLSITYATLNKIEKRTFSNLTTVKEIKLMKSEISELDFSAFANLPALVNLTVKENRVSEIQRDVFVDLPNLKYLDLTFNNISLTHDGCFEHLPLLSDLLLESNSISVLTRETFRGLANLTKLNLRANRLSMIGDLTFSELWNLNELLLDNNELKYLSERAFDGLSLLQKLSMTGNRLKSINEGLLEGVRGLELLDLRNNELEHFTYETLKPIHENLKVKTSVLYLSGNKLSCDCRLGWVSVLRNETRSEPLRLALEAVTCVPTADDRTVPEIPDKAPNDNILAEIDDDSDVFQQDANYDDSKPSAQSMVADQLTVVDIPADTLPCPQQLRNGEDSLMLSSKDKSYWRPSSSGRAVVSVVLVMSASVTVRLLHW
ncbi:hypothetical protein JYU34_013227 [Plutella xylostella]|uniref:Connectin n=1 Tax=Plutella xylostella TaxID=51655 RepID=A0ABQ7Q9L4_PLUXY|nr:hypothetical protein JYU34_013227 [Plutella xylostella]